MKNMLLFLVLFVVLGCTEQQRAKQWGGTARIDLPCEEKVEMVTWKQDQLWILTTAMEDGDVAERYKFAESASWGLLEGEVRIAECRVN